MQPFGKIWMSELSHFNVQEAQLLMIAKKSIETMLTLLSQAEL
jgi:hypothetical protein